jgi:glutathione S-transferase
MMPPLVMKLIFSTMVAKSPFFIRPISSALAGQVNAGYLDPNLKKMFALIDGYLARDGGRKWLAGTDEPTAADFMVRTLRALLHYNQQLTIANITL